LKDFLARCPKFNLEEISRADLLTFIEFLCDKDSGFTSSAPPLQPGRCGPVWILRTVQMWLGHSDNASTMRYLKPSRSGKVHDKVNEIFA